MNWNIRSGSLTEADFLSGLALGGAIGICSILKADRWRQNQIERVIEDWKQP